MTSDTRTPPADQRATEIEIRARSGSITRRTLDAPRLVLGRSHTADIQFDDPSVSRRHAELYRDPFGRWWIRDLESRFGTVVNGRPVTERRLSGGEEIRVGDVTLRLLEPATDAPSSRVGASSLVWADERASNVRTLSETPTPQISTTHLTELMQLGAHFSGAGDAEQGMRLLCEHLAHRTFRAGTALVLRVAPAAPDEPALELCRETADRASGNPYVSRSLVRRVCESREPALASNAPIGPVDLAISLPAVHQALCAIACPLREVGPWLDLLYLVLPPQFGSGEWLALTAYAAAQFRQAETTRAMAERTHEHERIERELRHAREMQDRLLPRRLQFPGLDLAIGFEPCRWVGGDYVDAALLADGRVLLVIGDVSGKGLPAALLTGNLHAVVHANIDSGASLVGLVQNADRYLRRLLADDAFVTLACLAIDAASGVMEYIIAGHPRPLLIGPDGTARELEGKIHMPLGVEKHAVAAARQTLEPGWWLLLHTDGATDIVDEQGQRLGGDGFVRLVAEVFGGQTGATADEMMQKLNAHLNVYQGRCVPADDRTLLLLRRT